jgi:hypothetical protein
VLHGYEQGLVDATLEDQVDLARLLTELLRSLAERAGR